MKETVFLVFFFGRIIGRERYSVLRPLFRTGTLNKDTGRSGQLSFHSALRVVIDVTMLLNGFTYLLQDSLYVYTIGCLAFYLCEGKQEGG